jgi:hypothetical protein
LLYFSHSLLNLVPRRRQEGRRVKHCELGERVDCALCGSEVTLGRDRGYAFAENAVLCFECAVCRGGVFDDAACSWQKVPSLCGLLERVSPRAQAPKRYWAFAEPLIET